MSTCLSNNVNFSDLVQRFIQDVCGGKKNETPIAYLTKLRYLERFLEEKGHLEITQTSIDEFKVVDINEKIQNPGKKRNRRISIAFYNSNRFDNRKTLSRMGI